MRLRSILACALIIPSGIASAQSHRYGWRGYPHTPDSPPPRYWSVTVQLPVAYFDPAPYPGLFAPAPWPYAAPDPNPILIPPAVPVPSTISVAPVPLPSPPGPKTSTPASRLRSFEHQRRGDEKLRKHLWAQAYMHYRSAIDAAGDLAEPRFRQGFNLTAMKHYTSAVREFKRGLELDPEIASKGILLADLFGPGSQLVRSSLLQKVVEWVGEDPGDPDRLFLLGLLLRFEGDERGREFLVAAALRSETPAPIETLLAGWKSASAPGNESMPAVPDLPAIPAAGDSESGLDLTLPPLQQSPIPLPRFLR